MHSDISLGVNLASFAAAKNVLSFTSIYLSDERLTAMASNNS